MRILVMANFNDVHNGIYSYSCFNFDIKALIQTPECRTREITDKFHKGLFLFWHINNNILYYEVTRTAE